MAVLVPFTWKASRRVASVSTYPTASMKRGSMRNPAKTRTPGASALCSSSTRKETTAPFGSRHVPSCTDCPAPFVLTGAANVQVMSYSSVPTSKREPGPLAGTVTGRTRNR